MSTFLPAVFGENMMDLFDDFDRDFFRGFGRPERRPDDEDRREGNR